MLTVKQLWKITLCTLQCVSPGSVDSNQQKKSEIQCFSESPKPKQVLHSFANNDNHNLKNETKKGLA